MTMIRPLLLLLCATGWLLSAADWHVILVDFCPGDDEAKVRTLHERAAMLNKLHAEGYPAIKPYFSVVTTRQERCCLVFGLRDQVRGLRKDDFPNMLEGLRDYEHEGARPFPHAVWLDWGAFSSLLKDDDGDHR